MARRYAWTLRKLLEAFIRYFPLGGALDGELARPFAGGPERLADLAETQALCPQLGSSLGADLGVDTRQLHSSGPLLLGDARPLDGVVDRLDFLDWHQSLRHGGYRKPYLDARAGLTQERS
jgi:hypothetical protein